MKLAPKLPDELKAKVREQTHKAACFDDLLAALEALQGFAAHGENKAYWHRMGEEAAFHKVLNSARAAIAKAKDGKE